MTAGRAAVALGSNLGDREASMARALLALDSLEGTRVLARSEWIETEPVGGPPQPRYLNGAVLIETSLPPDELLRRLLEIEEAQGRERSVPNGPRTLDLDLLHHGDTVCEGPDLCLPHPRLHERAFVLEPLVQVDPSWRHPRLGRTVAEMLNTLRSLAATAG